MRPESANLLLQTPKFTPALSNDSLQKSGAYESVTEFSSRFGTASDYDPDSPIGMVIETVVPSPGVL